jgi:VCBS repeat protein
VKPIALVAVDLVGDGKPDLAVANNGDRSVSILVNNRNPNAPGFNAPLNVSVPESPLAIAAADLDKDGLTDLVVASGPMAPGPLYFRGVAVLRNLGNRGGMFERAYDQLLVTPLSVATADLDGNGQMDVVLLGAEGLVPLKSACAP